ncbi:uncharacterized protein LOC18428351 [Amborella trichopoda]|nr:uncharacterized protein LOC18428351 [Amborella trichopoda]XP_020519362.1 uncharacterized protein LOC18428351 [Amborella trichopoda]XP_020519363.1 uncharacterized protein LOC18428351 [Amborella trichopoda]|eukprot:XP_011621237.1 uncharacterized protein LOC18428351 [Amborella trichopoda]
MAAITNTAAVSKEIRDYRGLRRSYSDPHIPCQVSSVRSSPSSSSLSSLASSSSGNDLRHKRAFPFPFFSGTMQLPQSLRSLLDHQVAKQPTEVEEEEKAMKPLTGRRNEREGKYEEVLNLVGSVLERETPETGGIFHVGGSESMAVVEESSSSFLGIEESDEKVKRSNWIMRLLELRSHWRDRQKEMIGNEDFEEEGEVGSCEDGCGVEEEEGNESLSKFLVRASLDDIKVYAQLAFLCNLAYVIPEIKGGDLWRYYRLRWVTSSLEKKAEAAAKAHPPEKDPKGSTTHTDSSSREGTRRASAAYEIAAAGASYVHSFVPKYPSEQAQMQTATYKSEMAAYMAASTMTAMVAAEEVAKQAAARELQSLHSSPCEWFVCDDPGSCTRCFVIQGSDSLSSWQANLLFEPTQFEGMDVLVHRGIYEAAKGIYEQFLPEILDYRARHGDKARFRFTGHSLGGSLSLLVSLMLVGRGVVAPERALPVVTFGSPCIMCGGMRALEALGLDEGHVHSVMMHRDVVPRAFSCTYPNHVAVVLKRLSAHFRNHPCLLNNKLLYSPMGQSLILQPDEKVSPPHPLLPPGSALYALERGPQVQAALRTFLNTPHPLETLSDPTAYGSEGSILRDHDSSNYLKAINAVLRQQTKQMRRTHRLHRCHDWWPLVASSSPSPHVAVYTMDSPPFPLPQREMAAAVKT